jgi:hypothetical protein
VIDRFAQSDTAGVPHHYGFPFPALLGYWRCPGIAAQRASQATSTAQPLPLVAARLLLEFLHENEKPLTTMGGVVFLDGSSLAIEQYNAMGLCSPINPDKIPETSIQDSLL